MPGLQGHAIPTAQRQGMAGGLGSGGGTLLQGSHAELRRDSSCWRCLWGMLRIAPLRGRDGVGGGVGGLVNVPGCCSELRWPAMASRVLWHCQPDMGSCKAGVRAARAPCTPHTRRPASPAQHGTAATAALRGLPARALAHRGKASSQEHGCTRAWPRRSKGHPPAHNEPKPLTRG